MIIYYAETSSPFGIKQYLGVFSTSNHAEETCQAHSKKHHGLSLKFVGFGDRIEAVNGLGKCYTVSALEINREVWR